MNHSSIQAFGIFCYKLTFSKCQCQAVVMLHLSSSLLFLYSASSPCNRLMAFNCQPLTNIWSAPIGHPSLSVTLSSVGNPLDWPLVLWIPQIHKIEFCMLKCMTFINENTAYWSVLTHKWFYQFLILDRLGYIKQNRKSRKQNSGLQETICILINQYPL